MRLDLDEIRVDAERAQFDAFLRQRSPVAKRCASCGAACRARVTKLSLDGVTTVEVAEPCQCGWRT